MIERILLEDFQNHVKTDVELDPVFTVVTGATGAGKSALLRGFRWLCLNQPSGDSFVGGFGSAPFARVRAKVDDQVVGRTRGKGVNEYSLGKKTYKSFGQGQVPEPVANLLNVTEVNFQAQIDPPFWFTETPGQVSKNLNAIVDLGAIDTALSTAAADVRRVKAELTVSESRYKEAKEKRDETAWATDFAGAVAELRAAFDEWQVTGSGRARIAFLAVEGERLRAARRNALDAIVGVKNLMVAARRQYEAGTRAKKLKGLLTKLRAAKAAADRPVPDLSSLAAYRKKADGIAERRRNLEMLLAQIKKERKTWRQKRKDLARQVRRLEEATKGKCPLCGQKTSLRSSSPTCTSPTGHP